MGKVFFDYIYRPDQPRLKSDFAKAIDVIGSPSEYRFLDKSGETKWCRVSSRAITEGREKIGIQGVLVDISRSKRLEEQLKKSQDSKELSDVTGNVEFILVVDDMPAQREIATSTLDRLGYRSQAVASGEEAIEFVRQHTVDLVILDMIMEPGIDGYETYRQIRSIHPAQKAVIASGYSETERVRKTQDSGAGRYIKKPYTLAAIGSAIKEELQRKEKGVL